jgi:predicted site-specific integrase-resolvase
MANRSIFQVTRKIEREFEEPIREVVAGFIPMGMTRVETAETLGVSVASLRTFCEKTDIRFPRNQPGRAERIRETMRRGPRARRSTIAGRTQSLTEWAEEYGIKRNTLYQRIRRGDSLRDALRV